MIEAALLLEYMDATLQNLPSLITRDAQVKYVNLASATILIYDYLITFPSEVKHIWPAPWRLGKILYFATRYPTFIDQTLVLLYLFCPELSPGACDLIIKMSTWILGFGMFIAEVIISVRTCAIWGKSRPIVTFLVLANFGFFILSLVVLGRSMPRIEFSPSPLQEIIPCNVSSSRPNYYIIYMVIWGLDAILLILTFYKLIRQGVRSRSPLVKTLYRDGALHFLCLFALTSANLMSFAIDVEYYSFFVELQRVVHSTLSARVILHLRAAISESCEPMSPMAFADNTAYFTSHISGPYGLDSSIRNSRRLTSFSGTQTTNYNLESSLPDTTEDFEYPTPEEFNRMHQIRPFYPYAFRQDIERSPEMNTIYHQNIMLGCHRAPNS